MRNVAFALAIGLISAGSAAAGPFGLEMGASIEELDVSSYLSEGHEAMLKSVPRPHNSFKHYGIEFSYVTGVCVITAISHSYSNAAVGYIPEEGNKLIDALTSKYGSYNKMRDDPAELPEENLWDVYWALPKGGEIETITLEGKQYPVNDSGNIFLTYYGKNYGDCLEDWDKGLIQTDNL